MNALNKAAKSVENAWCKNYLAHPGDPDRHCALGALALNLIDLGDNLTFDLHMQDFGPKELLRGDGRKFIDYKNTRDTHDALGEFDEIKVLAETIIDNFSDRVNGLDLVTFPQKVVYDFNDHEDTTREDVVSMMEKAAVKFDESKGL